MVAFLWFMAVVTVVLAVVGPKRYYWAVQAPFRRDPEATEPSDLGYGVGAVANWIVAGVLVIAAIAVTSSSVHVYTADEVRSAADSAASDIEADSHAGDLLYDATSVITGEAHGKLKVTELDDDGSDSTDPTDDGGLGDDYTTADRYQITNTKGKFPVCLTVTVTHNLDDSSFDGDGADTEVTDGACSTG